MTHHEKLKPEEVVDEMFESYAYTPSTEELKKFRAEAKGMSRKEIEKMIEDFINQKD